MDEFFRPMYSEQVSDDLPLRSGLITSFHHTGKFHASGLKRMMIVDLQELHTRQNSLIPLDDVGPLSATSQIIPLTQYATAVFWLQNRQTRFLQRDGPQDVTLISYLLTALKM